MHQRGHRRLSQVRAAAAVIAAVAALLLATAPWTGAWVEAGDLLAPAWPLTPLLAIGALILGWRRKGVTISALSALALCIPTVLAQPVPPSAPHVGFKLRVVTHNVWVNNTDPIKTASVLAKSGADILLLQEAGGHFASVLPMLARAFPYSSNCPHHCPLIILSRYPIEPVARRSPDRLWRQIAPGMMMDVRVRLPGSAGIVPVVAVHLARGQSSKSDLYQRTALAQAMQRANGNASILAGDFNLVPWSARMRSLDQTLAPLVRTTAAFSWPAQLEGRHFEFPLAPIDHVYAGSGWELSGVHRLKQTGSDHYPIAVDLIWQGPNAMLTTSH